MVELDMRAEAQERWLAEMNRTRNGRHGPRNSCDRSGDAVHSAP